MAEQSQGTYERGKTYSQVPANLEGKTARFADVDKAGYGVDEPQTQMLAVARLVQNTSGGALGGPGLGAKYASGGYGRTVDAVSDATNFHGIIDEHLTAAVPAGHWFWLVIEGPTKGTPAVGGVTEFSAVTHAAAGEVGDAAATNPSVGEFMADGNAGVLTRLYLSGNVKSSV